MIKRLGPASGDPLDLANETEARVVFHPFARYGAFVQVLKRDASGDQNAGDCRLNRQPNWPFLRWLDWLLTLPSVVHYLHRRSPAGRSCSSRVR